MKRRNGAERFFAELGQCVFSEALTRVALLHDFPEHRLRKGDVATVVESHEGEEGQEPGYSPEVFNAVGETIAVLVVAESELEPLSKNGIFHVRQFDEVAVA